MSNLGLGLFCKEKGIELFRTDVGDRYVLEKMLADGLTLGGEQSGHYIFRQFCTTGDGILSALQLISVMVRKKKKLSELANVMSVYPQILVNTKVPNSRKGELFTNAEIKKHQAEIEAELSGEGRILLRPSGTEPLARVMIEGKNQERITAMANELAKTIEKVLGN